MIVSATVRSFKSLVNLRIRFEKFTCLIGSNGSGKSSVLQAIDFASHMMSGDTDAWLKARGWESADLHSKLSTLNNIVIFIRYRMGDGRVLRWSAIFNRKTKSCTREVVDIVSLGIPENEFKRLFIASRGQYTIYDDDGTSKGSKRIDFVYDGSLLAHLREELLTEDLIELRNSIRNIRSLELLSPNLMRASSRDKASDIGAGGEKLSAYLYSIKGLEKDRLLSLLQSFYPSIVDFRVKQQIAGWKRLYLTEQFGKKIIETEARHINDGLLRILAILAQSSSERSVLLFDEIENGINPEITERLMDILQKSNQQIIVTTHSPMVLNYLEDDVARGAVQYVYRSEERGTKSRPFFSIPRINKKLNFMGPGEAFADTNFSQLTMECVALDNAKDDEEIAKAPAKVASESQK
ncbi:AAA family ATPase [Burkholderia gladioli]|uniref:AAA family ATPase n=1 Tax=Burkholderia gladioli TaxID=28095 RepID=UPI00163E12DC|nr:ATP-binding protein [Burkholderia gladioli]